MRVESRSQAVLPLEKLIFSRRDLLYRDSNLRRIPSGHGLANKKRTALKCRLMRVRIQRCRTVKPSPGSEGERLGEDLLVGSGIKKPSFWLGKMA
jgi:hypothetical protein